MHKVKVCTAQLRQRHINHPEGTAMAPWQRRLKDQVDQRDGWLSAIF